MRLGTRGSALALAQAARGRRRARRRRGRDDHDVGRPRPRRAATRSAGSARSTRRCSRGDVDLAVHSAKDVPARARATGIVIAAVPPRADPRDALCGAAVARRRCRRRPRRHELAAPRGAAAGAARRPRDRRAARQRRHAAAQLAAGDYDAIVLAAGGAAAPRPRRARRPATLDELVPAAGQGALAVTVRAGDAEARAAVEPLADPAAARALVAERALVERARRRLPHAGRRPRGRRRRRRSRCGRSSARPTAARGCATSCARSDPEALGAEVARAPAARRARTRSSGR